MPAKGRAAYGACGRWEAATRDLERTFTPWGLCLASRGGRAPCFPVLRLPSCQTECGGGHGLCSLGLRNIMALTISPTNREDKWESPFFPKQQHHLLNKNILLFYEVLGEGRCFQAAKHLEPPIMCAYFVPDTVEDFLKGTCAN